MLLAGECSTLETHFFVYSPTITSIFNFWHPRQIINTTQFPSAIHHHPLAFPPYNPPTNISQGKRVSSTPDRHHGGPVGSAPG